MDRKTSEELQDHMFQTYFSLRIGLAAIGSALPIVVLVAGVALHHVWIEDSISAYYHTPPRLVFFTTRDLFVGCLLAAAACLYLYKGFSDKENVALNLAGVFAALVALLPTAADEGDRGLVSVLHATSAVLFFLCIAYVSLFRSHDTLCLLPRESRDRYKRLYSWTGGAMIASPLAAVVLTFALGTSTLVFWVEALGVWAFSAYWIIKTFEMRSSRAEERALDAELHREVVPVAPSDEPDAVGVGSALRKTLRKMSPAYVEQIVPVDASGSPI